MFKTQKRVRATMKQWVRNGIRPEAVMFNWRSIVTRLVWMCFILLLCPCLASSQTKGSDPVRLADEARAKACAEQYAAKDFAQAASTCMESAEDGNDKSALLYSYIIGKGLGGVKKDETEAGEYLRKAAENGLAEAQREYGRYCEAQGIYDNALESYELADKQGDAEAHELLKKLQQKLNARAVDNKEKGQSPERVQTETHTQTTNTSEPKAQAALQKFDPATSSLIACQDVASSRSCSYQNILKFVLPAGAEASESGGRAIIKMGRSVLNIQLTKSSVPPSNFMSMYWERLRKSYTDLNFKFETDFRGYNEQERMIDGIPVTIIFYSITDRDGGVSDGVIHIRQLSGMILEIAMMSPRNESRSALSSVLMGVVFSDAFRQRLLAEAPEGQMSRYRGNPETYYTVNRLVGLRFGAYGWDPMESKDLIPDAAAGVIINSNITVLSWPDAIDRNTIRDRIYQDIANQTYDSCCKVEQSERVELIGVDAVQLRLITDVKGFRYILILTASNHSIMYALDTVISEEGRSRMEKKIREVINTFSFTSHGIEFGM
jgi:hypothetical protein